MTARKVIVGTNAAVGGPATTATIDSSNNPANSIINNLNVKIQPSSENLLKKPEEETVEYEAVKYNGMDDVTVVRPKTKTREFTAEDDHDLLVYLVNVFHNIISSDYKSVLNVVDQSGLVILDANSLIGVIARVCTVEESAVRIEIEDEVTLDAVVWLRLSTFQSNQSERLKLISAQVSLTLTLPVMTCTIRSKIPTNFP